MTNFRAILSLFLYVCLNSNVAFSQNASDIKLLEKMTTVLELDSNQVTALDSVFISFANQLDTLNAKIKKIQTSELSEEEINEQTSVLFTERKDLRSWKTDQIKAKLTPEQVKTYDSEIVAKARPVLHFGHNKANCKTCETPTDGAILKKP